MNRRNFIQLSGVTLGGLLFTDDIFAGSYANQLVQLPEQLFCTLDDGVHQLQPNGNGLWSYQDAWVKLKYVKNALKIECGSHKKTLSNIMLTWKYATKSTAMLMGDHWERTYGDLHFQKSVFANKMPWYFIQHDNQHTTCFGVKTGCSTICYWQVGDGKMQLVLDTRNGGNGVLLGDRTLNAAEIIATQSKGDENTYATASRFCKLMCNKPLLPKKPVYGINDWYITYGINSAEIILNHTARMAELTSDTNNRPFSVIDSGWAAYSPLHPGDCCWQDDFSKANEHFKDMKLVADSIKKLGMRPGLWTRPLCASHKDPQNLILPFIPGRTSTTKRVLDPSIDENLARIAFNIKTYDEWGYDLVKHDFTTYDMLGKWGFKMESDITTPGWNFNDRTKTTAELILNLYQTIRDAAGSMYLLGCNTISHLSAGLFEINRIGDDTSSKEWSRTRKMGVNTLGFRTIQHNNFYAADGDCVGLSEAISWKNNKDWMQLLAESGTPLFISAPESSTGAAQKAFIKYCFAIAAKKLPTAEPVDWLTNQFPTKWKLNGKLVTFNWEE
jgi:alpha-galactosidase